MGEYFVVTRSFAAPFMSDTSEMYVTAESPESALEQVAATYSHPCGLYSAGAYLSHKDALSGAAPAAMWLCNREIAMREATKGLGAYSVRSDGPGTFEVDGERHIVKDPKGGRVYREPTP